MTTTRINVNPGAIRANTLCGTNEPVILIRVEGEEVVLASEAVIHGPSRVVYNPDGPMGDGSKVWIETESRVEVCTDHG